MSINARSSWDRYMWGTQGRPASMTTGRIASVWVMLAMAAIIIISVVATAIHDNDGTSSSCQSAFKATYNAGYANDSLNAAYDSACAGQDTSSLVSEQLH